MEWACAWHRLALMSIQPKSAYHHGDLRQQLVNATRMLVEELGADGFSVSEACRRAGVSTAAPYRHFPDRQAMLTAVAEQGMHVLADRFEAVVTDAAARQANGSCESIAAIGLAYVEFAIEQPGVFRLMFGVAEDDSERVAVKEQGFRCFNVILNEVATFLGKKAVDEEVRHTTFPLWTFVHGAAFLSIDGKLGMHDMTTHLPDMIAGATRRLLGVSSQTNASN